MGGGSVKTETRWQTIYRIFICRFGAHLWVYCGDRGSRKVDEKWRWQCRACGSLDFGTNSTGPGA